MQDLEWIDGYKRTMTWAFMQLFSLIFICFHKLLYFSSCPSEGQCKTVEFCYYELILAGLPEKVSLEAWTLKDNLALTSWFAKEVMVLALDWFS